MTKQLLLTSLALIGLSVTAVLVPFGYLLPIGLLVVVCLLMFPLNKSLYYIWFGLVVSAFFGAYWGLPGYETIFMYRILLLLHGVLFLFLKGKEWRSVKEMKWLFVLLGAWLISFSFTLFWSESLSAGLRYMYYLVELSYLLFLSVYYVNTRQRVIVIARFLTFIYWFQMVIGLIEIVTGNHLSQSSAYVYETRTSAFQPTGLLFNTNDYAFFLALFFPLVFWYLTTLKQPYRFITLVLTSVLSSILVLATYSRLGFIVFFLVLLVMLVLYARELSLLIFAGVTLVGSGILLFSPESLLKVGRMIEMMFTQKGASTTERIELSRMLGQMLRDTNFLGVGAGNSPIKLEQYRLGRSRVQDVILAPHNFWLELLADGGIIGLLPIILIVLLWGLSLYYVIQKWRHEITILEVVPFLMLSTFIIAGIALSTVLDKRYLWLGVGMAASLVNLSIIEWKEGEP